MKSDICVASPPAKPLLVYDGDCYFCMLWIGRWQQITGEAIDYLPSQDERVTSQFPEIPRESFATSVQLIEPEGTVHSGAEAVFRSLASNPRWEWLGRFYENAPAFARVTEGGYRFVAEHRVFFSKLTRWFWGRHVERPEHLLTRWVFLRALGFIYLFAFISFWMQVSGLIGHNGVLPADQYMSGMKQQCEAHGIGVERYHLLPTLCWFDASDPFLKLQCAAGTVIAVLLVAGVAPVPCLALLWLLYLSLVTVGQEFFGFQWDNLLLEAGFLAIFFAPLQWLPRLAKEGAPSRIVLWLLRILLFKLMFSSGRVKLLSGDMTWHDFTALTYHYETQPLPTWIGWYAGHLATGFQKFSCFVMFVIELGAPFFIFLPRLNRFAGCAALVGLQLLIFLTGNYTFFNLLALALCGLLLDDFLLQRWLPRKLVVRLQNPTPGSSRRWPRWVIIPVAAVFIVASLSELAPMLDVNPQWLQPGGAVASWLSPFRSVNNYGLFAVMTTERREIVVEGSDDGTNWLTYEFKYKPGELNRRPGFVEPLQPRLDWQMWFAALGDYQQNPWFGNFCVRLLEGSPEVLALMEKNPFPKQPPRFIRAELYDYHFANLADHRTTGAWWRREKIGEYLPPVSLHE